MVGGARGGVAGAFLRLFPWYREDLLVSPIWGNDAAAHLVSAALFLGLCAYVWLGSLRRQSM